jgi:hypothetical protein
MSRRGLPPPSTHLLHDTLLPDLMSSMEGRSRTFDNGTMHSPMAQRAVAHRGGQRPVGGSRSQCIRRWHKGRCPAGGSRSIISGAGVGARGPSSMRRSQGHARVHVEEVRSTQIWPRGALVEGEVSVCMVWGGGGERHLGLRTCAVLGLT